MPCVSCGHDLVEAYCSRCGQRAWRSRFALGPLLRQAADDAINLDRGLLHTVLALSSRPGRAVAEYVHGRTRPFTNPVKYLVIWAAVATFTFFYSGLMDAQTELLGPQMEADEVLAAALELVTRYFNLFLIAAVPFLAGLSRLFFLRSGYNLAEHLIFNVYIYAHQNVIYVGTLPLYFLLADALLYMWIWMLLVVLYYIWACWGFFQVSLFAAAVRGVLVVLCGYLFVWIPVGLALQLWVQLPGR